MPGVYLLRSGTSTAASQSAVLAAAPQEVDLKQIYDKIDAAQDLVHKLAASNHEMMSYFLRRNDDDDADTPAVGGGDSDDDADDWHVDPHADGETGRGDGNCDSMEALLAMSAADEQSRVDRQYDDGDDEGAANPCKRGKALRVAPTAAELDELPLDIRDAVLENIAIIAAKKQEIKDLIAFSAARQHKCGCSRNHGTIPAPHEE